MKKFLSLLLVIGLISSLLIGCSSGTSEITKESNEPETVYKWRLVTHQMAGTSRYDETVLPFTEMVKEASGGRLVIEPYPAGALFPVTDSLDSVKNGVVEMSAVWSGYWGGKDPVFSLIGGIPGDPIDGFSEHFYRADRLKPVVDKAYANYGVVNLGAFDIGPPEIVMLNKEVKTLDDFNGLNVRTSSVGAEFYSALGGSPVSLPGPEVYTALQLGTVDVAEYNDWTVNYEMGFHEVTDYVIETPLHSGVTSDKHLVVNEKAWNELPEDLQAIVKSCMNEARFLSHKVEAGSKMAKNDFLDHGPQIIELSDADVAKAREIGFEVVNDIATRSDLCGEYISEYAKVLYELGYKDEAKILGYSE